MNREKLYDGTNDKWRNNQKNVITYRKRKVDRKEKKEFKKLGSFVWTCHRQRGRYRNLFYTDVQSRVKGEIESQEKSYKSLREKTKKKAREN